MMTSRPLGGAATDPGVDINDAQFNDQGARPHPRVEGGWRFLRSAWWRLRGVAIDRARGYEGKAAARGHRDGRARGRPVIRPLLFMYRIDCHGIWNTLLHRRRLGRGGDLD